MSNNRIYNVMFHTHTISGIIISAALYVIFFAGSISFFKEEIQAWENNETSTKGDYFSEANFDSILKNIEKEHELKSKDVTFFYNSGQHAFVSLSESKDTLANKAKNEGVKKLDKKKSDKSKRKRPKRIFIKTNLMNNEFESQERSYNLSEFFYRLHFFAQLNFYGVSGYIFAGFVSFFFLFAILTGVIVHWNKIISSFYVFRPKEKWKTIWTDAHVSLGMIGLPFQFMFAVTGCYLIIAYSIMLPPVKSFLFDNDAEAFEKVVYANNNAEYDFKRDPLNKTVSYNLFVKATVKKWPNLKLTRVQIFNFGDANMHIKVAGRPKYNDKFLAGEGFVTYRAKDNKVVDQKNPYTSTSYVDGSSSIIQRLHYGDYGGYGLKIIYFILGLVTCFVIISGVMIWLVARDKKNVPEYKRKFNAWLVTIYMAICLSIYPITALTFIVVKCFNDPEIDKRTLIYSVFFWSWLAISTLFVIKKDIYFTNKVSLILGSILGFFVPIANGIKTGNWPWITWQKGYIDIFVIDIFWIVLSLTTLAIFFKLKSKSEYLK